METKEDFKAIINSKMEGKTKDYIDGFFAGFAYANERINKMLS